MSSRFDPTNFVVCLTQSDRLGMPRRATSCLRVATVASNVSDDDNASKLITFDQKIQNQQNNH